MSMIHRDGVARPRRYGSGGTGTSPHRSAPRPSVKCSYSRSANIALVSVSGWLLFGAKQRNAPIFIRHYPASLRSIIPLFYMHFLRACFLVSRSERLAAECIGSDLANDSICPATPQPSRGVENDREQIPYAGRGHRPLPWERIGGNTTKLESHAERAVLREDRKSRALSRWGA